MSDSNLNRRQVLSATGAAIVGGLVMTGSAAAENGTYTADLTGEPLGVDTNASGTATVSVSDGEADYELWVSCLRDGTHVSISADGEVLAEYDVDFDGVVRDTVVLEGSTDDEALLDAIEDEVTITAHTEANPDGEIEGTLSPEGDSEPSEDGDSEEDDVEEESEESEEENEDDEGEEPEEEEDADEDDEEETISTAAEAEGSLTVSDRNVDVGNYNPDEEYITIQNTGENPIDMTGWYLRDRFDDGAVDGRGEPRFQFPDFVLDPGAEVRIWTGTGSDDDEDLYWGLTGQNVWLVEGDVVILQDSNEDIAMEYEYGNPPSSIQFFFNQIRSLFV